MSKLASNDSSSSKDYNNRSSYDDSSDDSSQEETKRSSASTKRGLLPALTGKRVLLTGGAGFIGSHTAEVLLARGDEVVLVDEVNDYYDIRIKRANLALLRDQWGGDRLRIYEGDLCDVPFITKIFEEEQPKWVVHLAARAGVRPSIQDPFIYIHSNVEATTRLLELARLHGNESFVFASSSSVYGGSKEEVFSETDVVDFPVSPYAATKKACELMAYTYHHLYGLNIAGLRFFTVYGPRGRPDMAPFKFVDRVSRGLEIQQFGDGSSSRDYTYIDDIVDGVVRSLDTPLGYQIYNLGNGNPVGLRDFIQIVEKATGKAAQITILPDQPGDVPRTAADISKARRLLGYEPKVAFAEGIRRLAAWYRDSYETLDAAQTPVAKEETNNHSKLSEEKARRESEAAASPLSVTEVDAPPPKMSQVGRSTSMLTFALGAHGEAGVI